jgi:hypothetical protein
MDSLYQIFLTIDKKIGRLNDHIKIVGGLDLL